MAAAWPCWTAAWWSGPTGAASWRASLRRGWCTTWPRSRATLIRTALVRAALTVLIASRAAGALAQPDRIGDADLTVTSLDRPVSLPVHWRQKTGDALP